MASGHRLATTRCAECGKWCYPSKKAAKRAGRDLHHGDHLNAYQCRENAARPWHIGHLPPMVLKGAYSRMNLANRSRGPIA